MAEATQTFLVGRMFDRARWERLADNLAVAVAVSLPWSTSATSILIFLWLFALLPTLDMASVRKALAEPAGGLPVAFWALGLIGMLWADAALAERISSLGGFHKILVIPLLLIQFQRSEKGTRVVVGFLVSCALLLVVSFVTKLFPTLVERWGRYPGVPVKDYVIQSGEFMLCAFALAHMAHSTWKEHRRALASCLIALAFVFLLNIVFIAASRAMLIVFPLLLLTFGLQRWGWKGTLGLLVAAAVLAMVAWASSPYLRSRVIGAIDEVRQYRVENAETSSGYRLEFWKKSIEFVAAAPVIGHGTGSVEEQFRRAATGDKGISAAVTTNPHNQTLTIAIQLGFVGVVVLYAMWISHLVLFWGTGLPSWLGLGVVVQNIVAAVFNAQLFYFTPGWLYVFGVGVLGGMVMASRNSSPDVRLPAHCDTSPFGKWAPRAVDRAVIALTRRLPVNWLGRRLAILLRRAVTMRLGGGAIDATIWGVRMRFYPARNSCEKSALFAPQHYDVLERSVLAAAIDRRVSAGETYMFIDLGANVGLYSLFVAARAGPCARVLAIEPAPGIVDRLLFNVRANHHLQIEVLPLAVADREGEVELVIDQRDSGGTRLRRSAAVATSAQTVRVPCRPLRSILDERSIKRIDALKIDIEGAEDMALGPFLRDSGDDRLPRLLLFGSSFSFQMSI